MYVPKTFFNDLKAGKQTSLFSVLVYWEEKPFSCYKGAGDWETQGPLCQITMSLQTKGKPVYR